MIAERTGNLKYPRENGSLPQPIKCTMPLFLILNDGLLPQETQRVTLSHLDKLAQLLSCWFYCSSYLVTEHKTKHDVQKPQ